MQGPYSTKAIANYFLENRKKFAKKEPITQLKLHKLLYFAHGWHLALTGKPLIDETLQAWDYGPVAQSIYHEFKHFRNNEITEQALDLQPIEGATFRAFAPTVLADDQDTRDLLDRVIAVYGKYTASQLSAMTHEDNSPWSIARDNNPGVRFVGIPNEDLRKYFAAKVARQKENGR